MLLPCIPLSLSVSCFTGFYFRVVISGFIEGRRMTAKAQLAKVVGQGSDSQQGRQWSFGTFWLF